ncbi:MAG: PspC domain-containing protein [Erysipelotrichaceae bacterium]|nr:PspC domain-containing protein [Erysipelotrichaceae bacterium]
MERKLCKGRDKKLAGVCSGIADYFGWDVTWVRIAAAVLALSYGSGLLIYIVAAIVMPEYTED